MNLQRRLLFRWPSGSRCICPKVVGLLIKKHSFELAMYFMSFFPLPSSVVNCIEKLQRDFLLGSKGRGKVSLGELGQDMFSDF